MELRVFRYRIYPSRKQRRHLNSSCSLLKEAYNLLLESAVADYKANRKSNVSPREFNRRIKALKDRDLRFKTVYSQALQNVGKRLSDAYKAFFRRCKEGGEPGFPRFKSHVRSITYPQLGFKLESDRRLNVSRIGRMPIVLHRLPRGKIKTLTIKQNAAGQWHAVFACEVDVPAVKHPSSDAVGIDVGLESFAVISDGTVVDNPRFLRKGEERIKRLQRSLSRKVKGSNNRWKATLRLARAHLKVENQRADFLHKLTRALAGKYRSIATEGLNIKGMTHNYNLAKSIHDASWGSFNQMLSYKAVACGGQHIEVDPRNTTKACSRCGAVASLSLGDRTFVCPSCGFVCHRDLNASLNILARGTAGLAGTNACGEMASTSDSSDASRLIETGTTRGIAVPQTMMPLEAHPMYRWEEVTFLPPSSS